jgi:hypothetical protein
MQGVRVAHDRHTCNVLANMHVAFPWRKQLRAYAHVPHSVAYAQRLPVEAPPAYLVASPAQPGVADVA